MTSIGFPLQHDVHFDPFRGDNFDTGKLLTARLQMLTTPPKKRAAVGRRAKAQLVIAAIEKHMSEVPNDYFLVHELGLAQMAAANFEDAAQSFKKVLELNPQCLVDYLHLGLALALAGKPDEGRDAIQQFQMRAPKQQLSPVFTNLSGIVKTPDAFTPEVPKRKRDTRDRTGSQSPKALPQVAPQPEVLGPRLSPGFDSPAPPANPVPGPRIEPPVNNEF